MSFIFRLSAAALVLQSLAASPSSFADEPTRPGATANSPAAASYAAPGPGLLTVTMPRVTPEQSAAVIQSRQLPAGLLTPAAIGRLSAAAAASSDQKQAQLNRVAGDGAAVGPASISELARALKNDPDLIYEYVRNNIEYYPVWGVHKGALGALSDNQGTAFDQASLMVSLLRQAGYTATYLTGNVTFTATQINQWLGISTGDACGVANVFSYGAIPIQSFRGVTAGSCSGPAFGLADITIQHVWVKVIIGGAPYVFDPSFKSHSFKTGVDIASAMGYSQAALMSTALSGATQNADYIQNVNRAGIRAALNGYANNLASWLRQNKPNSDIDGLLGGNTIIPLRDDTGITKDPQGHVRQTTLPYQASGSTPSEWTGDIPDNYRVVLRVQYAGINQPFRSDEIYGRRLIISYDSSNRPVLSLDGVPVATGSTVTPGDTTITFDVTHNAYADTSANVSWSQRLKAGQGYFYAIANGWGALGRGTLDRYQSALDQARAAGNSDSSEAVMGPSLALLSAQWIAQTGAVTYLVDRLANTVTLSHQSLGIAGYNGTAYVDLPSNITRTVSPIRDTAKETAAFYAQGTQASILESTAVQQTMGVSAVSTDKLLDMAAANGYKIFDATSSNIANVMIGLGFDTPCSPWLLKFYDLVVTKNYRLILPQRCDLSENTWSGVGYFQIDAKSIGAIIDNGLAGGFGTVPQTPTQASSFAQVSAPNPTGSLLQTTGSFFNDPIDMTKGNYLYSHGDISVGTGGFPYSLEFQRLYSSGTRNQKGLLGNGWAHNFNASVSVGSDGLQGLGEDSALDAAAALSELVVSLDLMNDSAKPVSKMVIAAIAQRWFGDQLLNNTVVVRQGLNGEVFVKLADGTYNPPPGNPARLILNADGTYAYETVNRAKMSFNAAGRVTTYTVPSGVQAKFTYTGNDLAKVENSLGRSLAFTVTGGLLRSISDGNGRSVSYGYTSNDLTGFTDANGKTATFAYDQPGRMVKLFYPSAPANPYVTNTYDTLGRVQTQTNAVGKLYTYYFAGSRSEEVAPGSIAKVSYLDAAGHVTRAIDPLGNQTVNTYDAAGRLAKSVAPEGNAVEYVYDDATCAGSDKRCTHNVLSIKRSPKPGSALAALTASFTYESAFNQVLKSTNPRSKTTDYTYRPESGLPYTVIGPADGAGVRPTATYDYTKYSVANFPDFYLPTSETHNITATTSVTNRTSYNTSNKFVPQTRIVDAGTGTLNLTSSYAYDAVGNLQRIDGPRSDVNDVTTFAYDSERRLTSTTDARNKIRKTTYVLTPTEN